MRWVGVQLSNQALSYIKFKQALAIAEQNDISGTVKINLIKEILKFKCPEDYISPVWSVVNFNVINVESASKIINKSWLIGFTEAEGSFYLVAKSELRLVHAFEITQKLDHIVLLAIKYILGIKTNISPLGSRNKAGYFSLATTNSRAIENIIKYYKNTMKGMKSFEYRVWSRSYYKYKGNYTALNIIRNRIRTKKNKLYVCG